MPAGRGKLIMFRRVETGDGDDAESLEETVDMNAELAETDEPMSGTTKSKKKTKKAKAKDKKAEVEQYTGIAIKASNVFHSFADLRNL